MDTKHENIPHPEAQARPLWPRRPHGPTSPSSCSPQALQGYCDGPQSPTRLEKALGSPAHYLVLSVKEGQKETSIDTLNPGSRQIAVEKGCNGLTGLRDLVVVVVLNHCFKFLSVGRRWRGPASARRGWGRRWRTREARPCCWTSSSPGSSTVTRSSPPRTRTAFLRTSPLSRRLSRNTRSVQNSPWHLFRIAVLHLLF